MERKIVSGIMLTLFLLISMLTLAFNIQPVKASGTIYIRADGLIDPPTAPISTIDNVTYAFTGNMFSASSQEWNRTYGGSRVDFARCVQQTSDGGYIVAGYTDSFGAGYEDVWLIKTDSAGNMLWNRTYGGWSTDNAASVQQTSDGGYIVAGYTYSFGVGGCDFWLIKTDASGNHQWNRTYGEIRNDMARSVVQTSDGGYIVAGYATWLPSGAGYEDVWLVKTDSSGNMQWNKTYGGFSTDEAHSIQQTSDGGYIVAGCTLSFGAGSWDVWLIKTDSAGNMQWSKTYGGINPDKAYSIQQTSDGGYIVAGYGTWLPLGAGFEDVWLVKTDFAGNMQWNKTYGEWSNDEATSVRQTTDGGYIVAGYTSSFGAGSWDFWLVKTDEFGNVWGNQTYGGLYADRAYSIQQTNDGGFIVAGYTNSFGAGSSDFWLIKVPASDFVVNAWPSVIATCPEGSANFTVEVSFTGGFYSFPVTLSVSGTPPNASASFSVNPVTPPTCGTEYSTLIISTTNTTSLGEYNLHINGTRGGIIRSINSLTLLIQHEPVKVTAPQTITVNPPIFKFDKTTKTLIISLGNMFLESTTGEEAYVSVRASTEGGIHVYIGELGTLVKQCYVPAEGRAIVPLWLGLGVGRYSGKYEFEITVCTVKKIKLIIDIVHIWVCENAGYERWPGDTVAFTTNLTGGSWAYLIADVTLLPSSWSYALDPANGTPFETPRIITLNITAGLEAEEGDVGIITLSAFSNETETMFWQFMYMAALDSTPPAIEVIQPLIHTPEGYLLFNTTVKDLTTGIESVRLFYSINYGPWNNQTMYWQDGDTFNSTTYTLPLLVPNNTTLSYYVAATDWLRNSAQSDLQTITIEYDLAATNVTTTRTIVGQGYDTEIYITIKNQGTVTETLFNVTLYADKNTTIIGDEILIGKHTVSSLASDANTTITFTWDTTGFVKGNYTIRAYAWPVPGETDNTDNTLTDGWIVVTVIGDVNGDHIADVSDLVITVGTIPSTPTYNPEMWNPNADINGDGKCDVSDLTICVGSIPSGPW